MGAPSLLERRWNRQMARLLAMEMDGIPSGSNNTTGVIRSPTHSTMQVGNGQRMLPTPPLTESTPEEEARVKPRVLGRSMNTNSMDTDTPFGKMVLGPLPFLGLQATHSNPNHHSREAQAQARDLTRPRSSVSDIIPLSGRVSLVSPSPSLYIAPEGLSSESSSVHPAVAAASSELSQREPFQFGTETEADLEAGTGDETEMEMEAQARARAGRRTMMGMIPKERASRFISPSSSSSAPFLNFDGSSSISLPSSATSSSFNPAGFYPPPHLGHGHGHQHGHGREFGHELSHGEALGHGHGHGHPSRSISPPSHSPVDANGMDTLHQIFHGF